MPRSARIVIPETPHHVIQRGNRRATTFFMHEDYLAYLALLREWSGRCGVRVWCYCLMPNHVHLILVPKDERGLARCMAAVHCRYAARINGRHGWSGHLWQERFSSFPMDESYTVAAARYILLNPVGAGLARSAVDWPYSSARIHVGAVDDGIVDVGGLREAFIERPDLIVSPPGDVTTRRLRQHTRSGRPLGNRAFLAAVQRRVGRSVTDPARGRPSDSHKE